MRDDDDKLLDEGRHLAEQPLTRDEGVLVEPPRSRVGCNDADVSCGADEYPEDPYSADNSPGTADDVGYEYGVELPDPADQRFVEDGRTHQRGATLGEERELDPGERDERDLWRRQRPLIEEDATSGYRIPAGLEDRADDVMSAIGDDVADVTESGEGVSATGATGASEHGGFPERDK